MRALLGACACLIAACASGPTARQPSGRPDVTLRVDARPGEFQLLRGSLDAPAGQVPKPIRFEFGFDRLQPSERWRPTLNLCVYVGNEEELTCLQVVKSQERAELVPQVLVAEGRSVAVRKVETPFLLDAQATHTLDVAFTESAVSFRLDGRPLHEQLVPRPLDAYYLSCSSAVCAVDVYQPPGRP